MKHSSIVGGSTAKRVMACPGSVNLCNKVPVKASSDFADRGSLLHNVISEILDRDAAAEDFLGTKVGTQALTQDLIDEKIIPALAALDEIDPDQDLDYMVEANVHFGRLLPDVFGSCDLLGKFRKKRRALVLDWKFGDGVAVEAEENHQIMFYTAAAMRTAETMWAFAGIDEIECVIVQPPAVKRWVTTPARIAQFEKDLQYAVKRAQSRNPEFAAGDHCRWCAGKPLCPLMTGAADRALKVKLDAIDPQHIGRLLTQADLVEQWITDLRALAFHLLESGAKVPGYKLVAKRGIRKWADEEQAAKALLGMGLSQPEVMESSMRSPAQIEKVLKKHGLELPEEHIVSISSGSTLAPESDPRPAVLQIGQQLTAALSKLV